jgi:transforming growth factor-beta-induced protein
MNDLSALICSDHYMTTFVTGLKAAGLEGLLHEEGPFTIFVPTNLSFGKLNRGVFDDWEKGKYPIEFKAILNHHIVEGKISFAQLVNGTILKSVDGQRLSVEVTGNTVRINKAQILGRDLEASNGMVHSIDQVITSK